MLTITLNDILKHGPCKSGWDKILAARGGESADYEAPFPLVEAFDSNGVDDVLWALRCFPQHSRHWRLFAVFCARQVEHLLIDERSVNAINVAEQFARGEATNGELVDANDAARAAANDAADAARAAADAAARAARAAADAAWVATIAAATIAAATATIAADAAWVARAAADAAAAAQAHELRRIITDLEN